MHALVHIHPNGKRTALRSLRTFSRYLWQVTRVAADQDGVRAVFHTQDGSRFEVVFEGSGELAAFMDRPTLKNVPVIYST